MIDVRTSSGQALAFALGIQSCPCLLGLGLDGQGKVGVVDRWSGDPKEYFVRRVADRLLLRITDEVPLMDLEKWQRSYPINGGIMVVVFHNANDGWEKSLRLMMNNVDLREVWFFHAVFTGVDDPLWQHLAEMCTGRNTPIKAPHVFIVNGKGILHQDSLGGIGVQKLTGVLLPLAKRLAKE